MQRWTQILLKVIALLVGLIFIAYIALAAYVNFNKKSLLASISKELNSNLNGTMSIESMDPAFLSGFPGVSISLNNVTIRDSLWKRHKHTLLTARHFEISVNALALITKTIRINKLKIRDAAVDLFTDSTGYSNTSVFKKKGAGRDEEETQGGSSTEIRDFDLENVQFVLDNRLGNKLFRISVDNLKGKIDYSFSGWKADTRVKILINDLAFNTQKGSFLKGKEMKGRFLASYDEKTGVISLSPEKISIGDDDFRIGGTFQTFETPAAFKINISADKILWKRAAALLADNIAAKLNRVDLKKPFSVSAVIAGNMGRGSKPSVDVACTVRDNILSSPGGIVEKCSFNGFFTNHSIKGRGYSDPNSQVRLYHFTGSYSGIPFAMDTVLIDNLKKPVASGTFKSKFAINALNRALGNELLKFNNGIANVSLKYKADIIDFKLRKPTISGTIDVKDADVEYVPRRLSFKNSSVGIHFSGNDLYLRNIRIQSGESIVHMEGSVKNFMNLYYTAPEKIIFNWQIRSPRVNLGEFIGFLAARKRIARVERKKGQGDFVHQLNTVLEKSRVNMHMQVDRVIYHKFTATDARADLALSERGIEMQNISLKHAGGSLGIKGFISQQEKFNHFTLNARVANVGISGFFYSFEDFGMTSLTSKNLRGYLFSKAAISGSITDAGKIVPRSLKGDVVFDLRKGALVSFEPIKGVGKFAFPFRNLDSITFSNLNGKFDIMGEKIRINPMMISSSVLNMNVAGIYSMTTGTSIALDVPLRNPKKDEEITDKQEIKERRMKGIVLHILASDGEDGKIKFSWNKNHD